MKEADEDEEGEQDESGEEDEDEDDEENGNCEENGSDKPAVKRDGTMVVTASVRSSTVFAGSIFGLLPEKCFR